MIYVDGVTLDEARGSLDKVSEGTRRVLAPAIGLLELHKALGVDPMAITDSIVKANGIDIYAWRNLVD